MSTPTRKDMLRALTDDGMDYFDPQDLVTIEKYGDTERLGTLDELAERVQDLVVQPLLDEIHALRQGQGRAPRTDTPT